MEQEMKSYIRTLVAAAAQETQDELESIQQEELADIVSELKQLQTKTDGLQRYCTTLHSYIELQRRDIRDLGDDNVLLCKRLTKLQAKTPSSSVPIPLSEQNQIFADQLHTILFSED